MPNIAAVIKSEIIRLSNKSARQYLGPIKSASAMHRRQIADLRKQVVVLERTVSQLRRAAPAIESAVPAPANGAKTRFVASGLRSLRTRLGLSAEEMGLLLSVSAASVYNWELKKAKPRPAQIPAIAALKGVGKTEVRARLDALVLKKPRPKKK